MECHLMDYTHRHNVNTYTRYTSKNSIILFNIITISDILDNIILYSRIPQ